MESKKSYKIRIEDEAEEIRVDKLVAAKIEHLTRHYIQKLIDEGNVMVNSKKVKSSYKLKIGDSIDVDLPTPKRLEIEAVNIELDIVYEDRDIIVINKPFGLVVHPGAGETHSDDSLVNAFLYHCEGNLSEINGVLRPGIVHRLDKDTSGLLVVAKNDASHKGLADQFKERKVEKIYLALIVGNIDSKRGTIEAPIGRDSFNRKKMTVVDEKKGRDAVTKFEVVDYMGKYTFVRINLLTGRTHQIRVHFSSIEYPVAGDPIYGKLSENKLLQEQYGLKRLFLHAAELSFDHPVSGEKLTFKSQLPEELREVLEKFKN